MAEPDLGLPDADRPDRCGLVWEGLYQPNLTACGTAAVVYMSAACKLPLTMDAAPPVCPANPMVAAAEPDPTVTAQSVAG